MFYDDGYYCCACGSTVELTNDGGDLVCKKCILTRECDNCGTAVNLRWGPDPYAEEINDDDTPGWLCDDCHEQARMDI